MPLVSRRPAQPGQLRRFLMLHPLEHVRDHQNPLADTPALVPCQAPQLRRPRFAAKEVCWHRLIPQTWYAYLITLPHLGIPGSRYKINGEGARPRHWKCNQRIPVKFSIGECDQALAPAAIVPFEWT